jgi:hypothetical protein
MCIVLRSEDGEMLVVVSQGWVQSGSVELRSAWHHDYPRARAVILRIA